MSVHDVILVLIGGGFSVGVLKFIEFLITLITNQKNRKEDKIDYTNKKISELRQSIDKRLTTSELDWKNKYCDKHSEAIAELSKISKGLKENIELLTKTTIEIKEYDKNVGGAITGIIHDRIIHSVESFIERGGITVDEISTLKSMYYPYKKLGGNGDVETAFEKATNGSTIPVITKEEALKRDILLQRKRIYGEEKTS